MKTLIISVKTTSTALDEITQRLKKAQRKRSTPSSHYEISFTEMKIFKRFISNIDILTAIQLLKPRSIYDLARLMEKDIGNVNKLIAFFEQLGAIEVKEKKLNGRNVKQPIVHYDKIEFKLAE